MNRVLFTLSLCTLAACGDTSIQGQVGVLTFDMSQATMVNSSDGTGLTTTFLVLSTDGDMCETIANRSPIQNNEAVIVQIGIGTGFGSGIAPPDAAGTYQINPDFDELLGLKQASVVALGSGYCLDASTVNSASGGTVDLTHVEVDGSGLPQRLVGSITADFSDGTITGTFDATLCTPQIQSNLDFNVFSCSGQ